MFSEFWWFQNTPLEQDRFLFGARLDFFDYDSKCYASKVKEAVHIRIHPNNINGDDEIEIPEASMLMIKNHNNRSVTKGTYKGTTSNSQNNYEYRNEPIRARHSIPITKNYKEEKLSVVKNMAKRMICNADLLTWYETMNR